MRAKTCWERSCAASCALASGGIVYTFCVIMSLAITGILLWAHMKETFLRTNHTIFGFISAMNIAFPATTAGRFSAHDARIDPSHFRHRARKLL